MKQVTIYDILGRPVERFSIAKDVSGVQLISVQDLPRGVYMVVAGWGGFAKPVRVVVL